MSLTVPRALEHTRIEAWLFGRMMLFSPVTVRPGTVQAIEYEIVDRSEAEQLGLGRTVLNHHELESSPDLGVLRCVDHWGRKVTIVNVGEHVRTLVESGKASHPDGLDLEEELFPIMVSGWRNSGYVSAGVSGRS